MVCVRQSDIIVCSTSCKVFSLPGGICLYKYGHVIGRPVDGPVPAGVLDDLCHDILDFGR